MGSGPVDGRSGSVFVVSGRTRKEFGQGVLDELGGVLWAADCQTCGAAFKGESAALCVDDLGNMVNVSLHHRGCRQPMWNDSGLAMFSSSALTTYLGTAGLIRTEHGCGEVGAVPMMLVNPSAEAVHATRNALGVWRAGVLDWLRQVGFSRVGESRVDVPVDAAVVSAQLSGDAVTVRVLGQVWTVVGTAEMAEEVRRTGMFLLVLSHMLPPGGTLTQSQFVEIVKDDRSMSACVGVEGYEPIQPSSGEVLSEERPAENETGESGDGGARRWSWWQRFRGRGE